MSRSPCRAPGSCAPRSRARSKTPRRRASMFRERAANISLSHRERVGVRATGGALLNGLTNRPHPFPLPVGEGFAAVVMAVALLAAAPAFAQVCCAGGGAFAPARLMVHEDALVGLQLRALDGLGSLEPNGAWVGAPRD